VSARVTPISLSVGKNSTVQSQSFSSRQYGSKSSSWFSLTIDPAAGRTRGARVPIHFGEMGCYKHTPPEVVLTWFDDTLSVLGDLRSGWALWNFRGPFGVLDTQRARTKFEDWHGHQLDRPFLALPQKKMKE
jgi:endoglucanase